MTSFSQLGLSMRRVPASLAMAVALLAAAAPGTQAQNPGKSDARGAQIVQLVSDGDFVQAAALTEQKLAAAERTLGREHPSTFAIANDLAELYLAANYTFKAGRALDGILEAQERVLGKEHPETLRTVKNLAINGHQAMWVRVREAPANVRAEWEKEIEAQNAQVLQFLSRGRAYAAHALKSQAVDFAQNLLGKAHPLALAAVNNRIAICLGQGDYGDAASFSQIALDMAAPMLGASHPQTLKSMSNLAQAQSMIAIHSAALSGMPDSITTEYSGKAEVNFKSALEAQERLLGKEHPDTLLTIDGLAGLYAVQPSRFAESEPLYKFVLEARERLLGKEHPDTLSSVNGLAELYRAEGRLGEAEPLYRRALETRERVLGREHPDTLRSVSGMAELYRAQGLHAEAETFHKRALEARERAFGPRGALASETIVSVHNLAELYRAQGRLAEAEPLLRRLHPGTRSTAN